MVVTLFDDTFMPALATDAALALELIAGFEGSESEASGWGVMRPFLSILNVHLVSPTRVVLDVPRFTAYSIAACALVLP